MEVEVERAITIKLSSQEATVFLHILGCGIPATCDFEEANRLKNSLTNALKKEGVKAC